MWGVFKKGKGACRTPPSTKGPGEPPEKRSRVLGGPGQTKRGAQKGSLKPPPETTQGEQQGNREEGREGAETPGAKKGGREGSGGIFYQV